MATKPFLESDGKLKILFLEVDYGFLDTDEDKSGSDNENAQSQGKNLKQLSFCPFEKSFFYVIIVDPSEDEGAIEYG